MMDYPLSPALRVFFMDLQGNTVGVAGRRRVSRSRPALDMEQRRLSVGGMMQGEAPDMGNSPSRVLSALYPGMPSADCFGIRLTAMPPSIDDLEKDVARCANLLRAASHIALAQAVVVHAQGHTHVRAGEPFRA